MQQFYSRGSKERDTNLFFSSKHPRRIKIEKIIEEKSNEIYVKKENMKQSMNELKGEMKEREKKHEMDTNEMKISLQNEMKEMQNTIENNSENIYAKKDELNESIKLIFKIRFCMVLFLSLCVV